MRVERINNIAPPCDATVALKVCGNVAEMKYNQSGNYKQRIRKLDKENYIDLATGEVRKFQHNSNRLDGKRSLKESLTRLCDYINTNVACVRNCRWLTLTYKDLMTETQRLYTDFKAFSRRCRKRYGHYEYIVAAEYQRRGSLHLHCVLIFPQAAPYMDNKEVATLWGRGFVNVRNLSSITDVGRYLTAYLGDALVEELPYLPRNTPKEKIKTVEVAEDGIKVTKAVIKGARLAMMPPGFHLYRISRGIKPPSIEYLSCAQAEERLRDWAQTYQTTYRLMDEERGFASIVSTCYYHRNGRFAKRCSGSAR
jgi:hypothetical protein